MQGPGKTRLICGESPSAIVMSDEEGCYVTESRIVKYAVDYGEDLLLGWP